MLLRINYGIQVYLLSCLPMVGVLYYLGLTHLMNLSFKSFNMIIEGPLHFFYYLFQGLYFDVDPRVLRRVFSLPDVLNSEYP